MEARSRRIFVKGLNKIFRMYSVDFEYAVLDHASADDNWGDDNTSPLQFKAAREPLIAIGTSARSYITNKLIKLPGGVTESFAFEWISKIDVPNETVVKYGDRMLQVVRKSPLDDLAGVYIYLLRGRGDHDVPIENL